MKDGLTGSPVPGNSMIREFEGKIARHCKVDYVLSVCNATIGILGVFHALGLANAEIITTPLSWAGALSGPIALNCRFLFCDVDPGSLTIDPAKVEKLISADTRAVFSSDMLGYPARLDELRGICDRYGLWLIHDAASSFGTIYKGYFSGFHAHVAILSFGGKKIFTTGEGGCIVTRNEETYHKLASRLAHPERQDIDLGTINHLALNTAINPLAAAYGVSTFEHQLEKIHRHQLDVRTWINTHGIPPEDRDCNPNYFRVLIPPHLRVYVAEVCGQSVVPLPFEEVLYKLDGLAENLKGKVVKCFVAERAVAQYCVCIPKRFKMPQASKEHQCAQQTTQEYVHRS